MFQPSCCILIDKFEDQQLLVPTTEVVSDYHSSKQIILIGTHHSSLTRSQSNTVCSDDLWWIMVLLEQEKSQDLFVGFWNPENLMYINWIVKYSWQKARVPLHRRDLGSTACNIMCCCYTSWQMIYELYHMSQDFSGDYRNTILVRQFLIDE